MQRFRYPAATDAIRPQADRRDLRCKAELSGSVSSDVTTSLHSGRKSGFDEPATRLAAGFRRRVESIIQQEKTDVKFLPRIGSARA